MKQEGCYQRAEQPKRVLIVDDDAFFRTALKDYVSRGGYQVVGLAKDGIEGIEKTRSLKPDIVILDIIMPVKNGLVAAKEIKDENPSVHIVMCTSLKDEIFVKEAKLNGVSAFIKKPFEENLVIETLNTLVS